MNHQQQTQSVIFPFTYNSHIQSAPNYQQQNVKYWYEHPTKAFNMQYIEQQTPQNRVQLQARPKLNDKQ